MGQNRKLWLWVAPGLAFLLVASVALAIWFFSWRHARETLRLRTELTTEQVALRLEDYLGTRLAIVREVQDLWRRGVLADPDALEDYAAELHRDLTGLQAINFVDPQGIIRRVIPEEPNRAAKGRDLKVHPEAAATFLEVMRDGRPRLTPPLTLLQGGRGIAAYFPLVRGGVVEGYLNAVFRTQPLVEACLGEGARESFGVEVRDGAALAYAGGAPCCNAASLREPALARRTVRILDRIWSLSMVPSARLADASDSAIPEYALAVGLVLAGGLALLLRRLAARGQALHSSEQQHRVTIDSIDAGILVVDRELRVRLANRVVGQWRARLGVPGTGLLGRPLREALPFLHAEEEQEYRHVFATGTPLVREGVVHAGGLEIVHETRKLPLVEGGVVTRVVAVSQDVTERRRAEQQMFRSEKMAALGQVVAGVAHEINNPNNFIYFNLPILRRYLEAIRPCLDEHFAAHPDEPVLEMPYEVFLEDLFKLLDNMQHGSVRITEIVKELKDYLRSHKVTERRPEALRSVVDRVMTLIGKQVRKTVRRFDVTIEDDLPPVLINAGRIEQVLINILINAGQAADKEDSRVEVRALRSAASADRVALVIEDNGCGIPPEVLGRIFDPFFTTKGRDAGTGLGLAISQRIVEEHGGTLSVQSEVGKGTRFVVELPVAP